MPPKSHLSLVQRTVTITAIKVDGSKMTTSVFRQIPEENIFDDNFKMRGMAWGTINYFWKEAHQFNTTVLHVLWQDGDELRRDRFSDVINGHENHQYSRENYIARFTGEARRELSDIEFFFKVNSEPQPTYLWVSSIYDKFKIYPPNYYKRDYSGTGNSDEYQKAVDLANKLEKRKIEVAQEIKKKENDAEAYIAARQRAYQKLAQLPQLYLA